MEDLTGSVVIKRVIVLYRTELSAAGGIVFLATDSGGHGKPSRHLLDLFSSTQCLVRPASEALVTPNGVFPQGSRRRTYVLEITRVGTVRAGQMTIDGQLYGGVRGSSRWRAQLGEISDRWTVEAVRVIGVS